MATVDKLGPNGRVVIIGAGIAGVRVAISLRDAGFAGSVELLSDEDHEPYDRPPLSKDVLTQHEAEKHIALTQDGELARRNIRLRLQSKCSSIDPIQQVIKLVDGEEVPYDRLVIATGSSVRVLGGLEADLPSVHYLRTLDDALALKADAERAERVAIVGAGVIGLEVAASLANGRHITVIDPAERPMMRSAAPEIGYFLQTAHEAAGVKFRFQTTIKSISYEEGRILLQLSDGQSLKVDLIVVGAGVVPNVELALQCGLDVEAGGVVVDDQGRTSDPHIYAAGEVAWHPNPFFGRMDKQETWEHAAAHGEHVGKAILDQSEYTPVPSYWSDQYDIALQVVGSPTAQDNIVRGDQSSGSFIIFHFTDGVLKGASSVNAARDLRIAKKVLGKKVPDTKAFGDIELNLKELAAQAD